eukprot:TRINITY_DN1394_c0_g1_i2.p1 TRINITY_DN1394_c0_g1~~TRINITY_DN1394_c0_g1_i2.p1  ORF type:complete len:255 (-),score=38.18 TRINITY_DN1394_c0_g1_i2:117-881(-)
MPGGAEVHKSSDFPSTLDTKDKTEFRNYSEEGPFNDRVSKFYWTNRRLQTYESVQRKKSEILKLERRVMTVWDAVEMLNEIVDQSDPDTDSTQIVHLLQTAEAIRMEFPGPEFDWFHLTGFLHDLGKVLSHPKLYNEPQWFMSKLGIYHEGIGLDNVEFSFGHDEYLYQVCVQNGSTLPIEALYIIRYHSFYPWHTYGSYTYLTNETDREMLRWVKLFQKFDLYSKLPDKPDVATLIPYYQGLIKKYFPETVRW